MAPAAPMPEPWKWDAAPLAALDDVEEGAAEVLAAPAEEPDAVVDMDEGVDTADDDVALAMEDSSDAFDDELDDMELEA